MRAAAVLLLAASTIPAQFKSTVPLVVAPTTVTAADGDYIEGLTPQDLTLYDNNVPQAIQVDTLVNPISLVVVVQASANSVAILDKLGRSASLFTELLSGDKGETALVSFDREVRLAQDFTADPEPLSRALRNLRVQGERAAVLDGIMQALRMLARRSAERRRVILVIAEQRDRSSKAKLAELLREPGLQNTAIYWLHYSPFLAAFTNRPKTVWDRMRVEERGRYPTPEQEAPLPPELPPGGLHSIFTELMHRTAPDAAGLLSVATGGRTIRFLKRNGLEEAIQAVAAEVHRQYIVTFQPPLGTPGLFHTLRVEVKGRPDLHARTRAGYWSVQ